MNSALPFLNELACKKGIKNPFWSSYAIRMIADMLEFGTIDKKEIKIVQVEQFYTIQVMDRK